MVIMVGYFFLTRDNVGEIEAARKKQDSIAQIQRVADSAVKASTVVATDTLHRNDSTDTLSTAVQGPVGTFGRFAQGTKELVTIENELIKVQLSTKGGHPQSVELKNYKRAKHEGIETQEPLILFENNDAKFNIRFVSADGFSDSTSRLYFTPSAKNVTVKGDSSILSLKIAFSETQYLEQIYWLKPNSYELFYTVKMVGIKNYLSNTQRFMQMDWQVSMPLQEHSLKAEKEASTVYYRGLDKEVDYISETKYEQQKPAGGVEWVSFKQKFFNTTLISLSPEGFSGSTIESEEMTNPYYVKTLKASTILTNVTDENQAVNMKFYFGPNKYEELKKLNLGMDKLVQLGWGIFGWINKGMILPIFKYLNKVTGNYGIIILLMTLIIKALLFGLVYRSYISSAKMRILKPEIDELKAKHGDNMQKIQQEQMALFKRAGVSPLGGCLPLLLQMPFLIAMFQFFPNSIELRQQSFLWAFDLSTYDSIWDFGKIPLLYDIYGDHVSLFTLLMTVSTLIYTMLNNQLTGVTGQMKYIGYIMPIFFLGFFNNYAAGLTYYYFLTNMVSIAQQFIIRRFVDEDALHRKIQENKKKPVKKSAFQQRLEDMAKKRGIDPTKR
jgi:YidC/Oxa1 family membrane protein insertase